MYISLSIRCQDVKMSYSDIYIKLDSGTLIWMHSQKRRPLSVFRDIEGRRTPVAPGRRGTCGVQRPSVAMIFSWRGFLLQSVQPCICALRDPASVPSLPTAWPTRTRSEKCAELFGGLRFKRVHIGVPCIIIFRVRMH